MNNPTDLLEAQQIKSMREILIGALEYHFSHYNIYEKQVIGFDKIDFKGISEEERKAHFDSFRFIKFETLAYLFHLRRFRHFVRNLKARGKIVAPISGDEKEIWDLLIEDDGSLDYICNKWVVHRSCDDPRGESEATHLTVVLNLDGWVITHDIGGVWIELDGHIIYLSKLHPKVINFINWVFTNIS